MDSKTPIHSNVELLYIVSLAPSERVHCQHPGCNRTIYAQIHIVRIEHKISFVGSTCFKKLFGHLGLSPTITPVKGTSGSPLSSEERQRLIDNTEGFLNSLREIHEKEAPLQKAVPEIRELPTMREHAIRSPTMPAQVLMRERRSTKQSRAKLRSVYGCFQCSIEPNKPYEFRSPDRVCPRCGSTNNFTWRQEEEPS